MKKSTKIFSLIVAIMMLVSAIPMNIFAVELNQSASDEIEENDEQVTVAPEQVGEDCVAVVDGTEFTDLAEALKSACTNGGTVILCKDATLGEKITVSADVTITGEYTITRSADYTGTLFAVNADASLTLDGGLTIDGGNNWSFDKEAYNNDLYSITQVLEADATKYFTLDENAPIATAYMITTSGVVNLNDVTIKNHYSNASGIVSAGMGADVTLDGAYITHCASATGSGLVVNASSGKWELAEYIKVTMNEGTVIDGNHVGGNHGIFKIYMATTFTMNGGVIKNTTGYNSNGTAVGIYWAKFVMNGGEICSNSSVYGPSNGRNASIYAHSASTFEMNGGTICHNVGRSRGGVDAPYTGSSGNAATAIINGGAVVNNVSLVNNTTYDVNGGERLVISGGTFTQDVCQWIDSTSGIDTTEDGAYVVIPDSQVKIGETGYQTLQEAISSAKAGDVIKLFANITLDADDVAYDYNKSTTKLGLIHVPSDKSITIDLNGHTIASSDISTSVRYDVIVNEGTLTIVDTATAKGAIISNNNQENLKTSGGFAIVNYGTMTLNGIVVDGNTGSYAIVTQNNGAQSSLEITDCTVSGRGAISVYAGSVATINSGKFFIDVQTGNTQDNVVYLSNSTAIINGGEFDGTNTTSISAGVCADGASSVTINGGEFAGKTYDIQSRGTSIVSVKDGSFKTAIQEKHSGASVVVEGGVFTYAVAEEYCADGFKPVDNGDGTYSVAVKTTPVISDIVINLNESLDIKFVVNKADITDGYYIVVTHANHAEELRLPIADMSVEGDSYVIICTDIAAKEMVDKVSAIVYNENDEIVSEVTTSIRDYAMELLESTDNDSLKTLIVDTLNYGAATQEYLGYKTEDLANAYLTEEQKAYATEYVQSVQPLPLYENLNLYGTSLSVRDTFTLKFYFKGITSDMSATVSMSDGTTYEISGSEFKSFKNGIMIIDVNGLTVYDAGEMVECTVTDAQGNVVARATQNIANYLTSMIAKNPENSVYEYIFKYIMSGNMYEE